MQLSPFRPAILSGGLLLALVTAGAWLAGVPALASAPSFKVYVERTGAYRLSFEDLAATGLGSDSLASAGLGLTCAGKDVPIHVADGGDGSLGPGDWIEFVGVELRGEVSYFHEHSRYNVYFLRLDHPSPARMTEGPKGGGEKLAAFRGEEHFEEDLLLLRLKPERDGELEELWYWAKLVMNAEEPFTHKLDLPNLANRRRGGAERGPAERGPAERGPAEIRIHLRGWSQPRAKEDPEMADHRVDVALNGAPLATAEWNGTRPYLLEAGVSSKELLRGENVLELRVPRRRPAAGADELIDVVMLNWIEISYPRDEWIGDGQAHLVVEAAAREARLTSAPGRRLVAYGHGGSRSPTRTAGGRKKRTRSVFAPPAGESSFVVTDTLLAPAAVVADRPSRLADPGHRADYVVIAHRKLLDAVEPLAELHRSRGLAVEVVDLQDVYDEFHHGVADPRAIRSFLRHAYETWQRPAPRFVLLVGDASWDLRNAEVRDENYADWTFRPWETDTFAKNTSYPYPQDATVNDRGLVPTWSHATFEGHSASDNFFVAVAGGDFLPDMAIGRLPVVEPEEVARIVDKTVRYATAPEVGPWRRNALFITNESQGFQRQSDRLARRIASGGFAAQKVYPAPSEATNEHHTERLVEAFDEGKLLVHFLGHGGRYIWRTGPPDLKKNHDLFTLEHLERLAPGGRLPVVLSLTCYSAPFDHPNADSIGEKLLRLDGRGAIAVFAASWRNSPSPRWGQVLLEELTRPGATVGEAVTEAKRRIGARIFVETYNLLGDPALPVALPAGDVALEVSSGDGGPLPGGPLHVVGTVGVDGFAGEVLVEAVDESGNTLKSVTLHTDVPGFALDLELAGDELAAVQAVRAYAWNVTENVDAAGAFELVPVPEPPVLPARRRARRAGKTGP